VEFSSVIFVISQKFTVEYNLPNGKWLFELWFPVRDISRVEAAVCKEKSMSVL